MNGPREYLPDDLIALRYFDAVSTGDLQTVADLWDAASHDPRLEQSLAEIDAALVAEAPPGNGQLHSGQLHSGQLHSGQLHSGHLLNDQLLNDQLLNGRPRPSSGRPRGKRRPARHWPARAAVLSALTAACWLMIVMRAKRDEPSRPDRPQAAVAQRATADPMSEPAIGPIGASRTTSANLSAWRQTRRALRGEPPPPFAWPLQNTLTMSIPSDLLD
jgi:hypothetical protein